MFWKGDGKDDKSLWKIVKDGVGSGSKKVNWIGLN